jgi:D-alanyl-D-alanine carboxypeptidase
MRVPSLLAGALAASFVVLAAGVAGAQALFETRATQAFMIDAETGTVL